MRKWQKIVGVVVVILIAFLFGRFIIGGAEDSWVCEKGEWVKHGYPSSAMPIEGCGGEKWSSATKVKRVIDYFYHWYLQDKYKYSSERAYWNRDELTDDLKKRLDQQFFSEQVNSDPLICSQSDPIDIVITEIEVTDDQATAKIKDIFNQGDGEETKFEINLIKTGNLWQIDEIICSS